MTERFRYDRSSKWLIDHQGGAILRVGGCQAALHPQQSANPGVERIQWHEHEEKDADQHLNWADEGQGYRLRAGYGHYPAKELDEQQHQ